MAKYTFQDQEAPVFELIPNGEYPFEVVAFDTGLSNGKKTRGSEQMEIKVMIFKDKAFTVKLGTIKDTLIFHESCAGFVDTFTKSSNLLVDGKTPAKGQEIDYCEATVVGLRGLCYVGTEPDRNIPDKMWNRIKAWVTNKEKFPKAPPQIDHMEAQRAAGQAQPSDNDFE